jgi:UDP-N-acetylglucosamine 2-epimerase (non-hydrolysing)
MDMKIKKIIVVVGTRPEAIKMASVVYRLRQFPELFHIILCVSGQHREMLDETLRSFDLKPDVDLNIMIPGQDLFDVTSTLVIKMRELYNKYQPDLVLVHGDTTTCYVAALSAFYSRIPLGHVEAGLRTYKIFDPFPEEFNRQSVGKLATYHFAPTDENARNLEKEGVHPSAIEVTGNTVIDSLLLIVEKIKCQPAFASRLKKLLFNQLDFDIEDCRYVLITGHRRENFGAGIFNICEAIKGLADTNRDLKFVYPVHPNPNIQATVYKLLKNCPNVVLIGPQSYDAFVMLLMNSEFVLTDSGGIQEEAPTLGKKVLVMRDITERPEGLESGMVRLVGTNVAKIIDEASILLVENSKSGNTYPGINLFGDGSAAARIVEFLKKV